MKQFYIIHLFGIIEDWLKFAIPSKWSQHHKNGDMQNTDMAQSYIFMCMVKLLVCNHLVSVNLF